VPESCVIAVVGASGGLGVSTVALAVGRRLAATGPQSTVVDLDLAGGGLDVTAGIEHLPGRRWPALCDVRGQVDVGPLVASLPQDDGCSVLSAGGPSAGPVPQRAVDDVLGSLVSAGRRVVVDCGRGLPSRALVAAAPLVVLLVSLSTRGLADADARLEALLGLADLGPPPDVRLVTRGAGRAGREVVDDVVAHLGVGHLVHLPDDPRVRRDAERGLWPATGRDAVRRVADAVVVLADGEELAS
jgi:hypothetical protein